MTEMLSEMVQRSSMLPQDGDYRGRVAVMKRMELLDDLRRVQVAPLAAFCGLAVPRHEGLWFWDPWWRVEYWGSHCVLPMYMWHIRQKLA